MKSQKRSLDYSLTHRMYESILIHRKIKNLVTFSKDWAAGELDNADKWRVAVYVNALLVDIFDTYEKVEKGFVDETHLKMRMHMLKLGTMKAPIAQSTWKYWRGLNQKNLSNGLKLKFMIEQLLKKVTKKKLSQT